MKKLAKVLGIILAMAMIMSCACVLVACGKDEDNSVAGTYTYTNTDKGDIASYVLHTGYFSGVAGTASLKDTLTLNQDGTYVLNKYLDYGDDNKSGEPVHFSYTYYGTYTAEGKQVTLKACTKADYEDETGTALSGVGFTSSSKNGVTDPTEKVGAFTIVLFNTFNTEYLYEGKNCVDQVVKLDGANVNFVNANGGEDDEELVEDDLNNNDNVEGSFSSTIDGSTYAMTINYKLDAGQAILDETFVFENAVWGVIAGYSVDQNDHTELFSGDSQSAKLYIYKDGSYKFHWFMSEEIFMDEEGTWNWNGSTYTLTLTPNAE